MRSGLYFAALYLISFFAYSSSASTKTLFDADNLKVAPSSCVQVLMQNNLLPRLHPTLDAKTQITGVIESDFGPYYLTNIHFNVHFQDNEVMRDMGLLEVHQGQSMIPFIETANRRLLALRPKARLQFVADSSSTIGVVEYLRYLADDQLPIGFGGQYLHDFFDHAAGYVLLSETPAWENIKTAIRNAFLALQKPSARDQGWRMVMRINTFLEAATTGLGGLENPTDEELAQELDYYIEMTQRIATASEAIFNSQE